MFAARVLALPFIQVGASSACFFPRGSNPLKVSNQLFLLPGQAMTFPESGHVFR